MFSLKKIDINLFILSYVLVLVGLITIYPIEFTFDSLFFKQLISSFLFIIVFFVFSQFQVSLLRGPGVSFFLYLTSVLVLISVLIFGVEINGAKSWFLFGPISIQPIDFVKVATILVMARYFAYRHNYIKETKVIIISIILVSIVFLLTLLQPDLGSSVTLLAIWLGITFASGISKKQLLVLAGVLCLSFVFLWQFIPNYQQERLVSFIDQDANLLTTGYNAYQSRVAVGSGGLIGKGIGEGTQSKFNFLPVYESDFIFAAFAEEWGFVGVAFLLLLYGFLYFKLLYLAYSIKTNFKSLFIIGVASLLFFHTFLHIAVNVSLLPVTGITIPFMSYGGSHLIAEAIMLGLVSAMVNE